MKALVLEGPQQLRIGSWPDPVCGPGDVLLRPIAAGICAGDQHLTPGAVPTRSIR